MTQEAIAPGNREDDWARSERMSFWIALAVPLGPILIYPLFSRALGSPPLAIPRAARSRRDPGGTDREAMESASNGSCSSWRWEA